MFNITTADDILKNRYIGPIREQLENSSVLFSEIKKETLLKLSGKNWTVPLHTRRNLSAGIGRAEGATLRDASEQGYDAALVPEVSQYGSIELTGQVMARTRDDAGAFIRALSSEVAGCARDMIKSFNRQLHSDGTDALAFYTAVDVDANVSVDDGQGNGFQFMVAGDIVDVLDASAGFVVLGGPVTVTAVGVPTGIPPAQTVPITLSAGVAGTADNDIFVKSGTRLSQLMGIRGIISDVNPPLLPGGLHSIPVAGNNFWRAQVFGAGALRALTLQLLRRPLTAITSFSDFKEGDVKFVLTAPEGVDEYYILMSDLKRFVNTLELDGGFRGPEFCGIPIIGDPECRKNVYYYVVPETMNFYESAPLDWRDKDGSILHRRERIDAYMADMYAYFNLGTRARNANGLLSEITFTQ